MKLLLYCTKSKPLLCKLPIKVNNSLVKDYVLVNSLEEKPLKEDNFILNGKIVAECEFEVSEIKGYMALWFSIYAYTTRRENPFQYFSHYALLKASCLNDNEIYHYLGTGKDDGDVVGYAIHIKNLVIYDEPKELWEVRCKAKPTTYDIENMYANNNWIRVDNYNGDRNSTHIFFTKIVDKAPQNMMYVYDKGEKKILISIRPQWLCKILNGEKTIEVRRKVLKEML